MAASGHLWPQLRWPLWFILKVMLLLFVFLWVRATTPRYRYDQLMQLGWKIFSAILADLGRPDIGLPAVHRQFAGGVGGLRGEGYASAMINSLRSFLLLELGKGLFLTLKYFFKPKVTINYPYEEAAATLPRRACAPVSEWRGALHCLQAVRGGLPGTGHHHRGRATRGRVTPHHALRHRHDEVYLLRFLPVKPARLMPSSRGRISSLRRKPARSCITTRTSFWRMATGWETEIARNLAADSRWR